MIPISCPVCADDGPHLVLDIGRESDLVECDGCHLLFTVDLTEGATT